MHLPLRWQQKYRGATLVYDGTPTGYAAGWFKIKLDTPFVYSANNLEIIVFTNYGSDGGESSTAKQSRYGQSVSNSTQVWYADYSAPTGTGSRFGEKINAKFLIDVLS